MKRSEEYIFSYLSSPFVFMFFFAGGSFISGALGVGMVMGLFGTTATIGGWRYVSHNRYLAKKGITHSEYKMIGRYVKETENKLRRIRSYTWKSRSIRSIVQIYQLQKASKKMIEQIKTHPLDYYKASDFFHHHMDTALSLIETISKLDTLKGANVKRKVTINGAKHSLTELTERVTLDYESLFQDDVENLDFTVKLANQFSSPKPSIKEPDQDDQKYIR